MVELEKNVADIIKKAISEFELFIPILINKDIEINKEIITKLVFEKKSIGIVYQFCIKKDTEFIPVYIGRSRSIKFNSRLRAHLCNIGKGTQSKFKKIQEELEKGTKIYLRYIQTNPDSLRNLIEEELINRFNPNKNLWNYKN
jgi:hypothetical protein